MMGVSHVGIIVMVSVLCLFHAMFRDELQELGFLLHATPHNPKGISKGVPSSWIHTMIG